jgi:hypothetical protein
MSANLAVVPEKALAKVIHQINKLESVEQDIIALLPSMTDDQVIETRNGARLLGCSAWKIEVACDAEIWDRNERAMRGRGNKDVEEKGILAAVNKRAAELGCGASTIRSNAALYKRFKNVLSGEHILDDKGFYQAAMSADDPDAAIETFAKERSENPTFRPADAWRKVKASKNDKPPHRDDLLVLQDADVRGWLEADVKRQREDEVNVPLQASFLRMMIHSRIGQAEWQLARTVEGDCNIVREAAQELLGSADQVSKWLQDRNYFMSREDIAARLQTLIEQGRVEEIEEQGRKAGQKGGMKKVYLPIRNPMDVDEDFEQDAD